MPAKLAERVLRLRRLELKIRQRLNWTRNARLATGGGFFLAALATALWPKSQIELVTVPVLFIVFIFFVVRSRRLERFVNRLNALAEFYHRQDLRQRGLDAGRDGQQALTALGEAADLTVIHDLNLIGPHSLFSLLDETITDSGSLILARWLTKPELTKDGIDNRQRLVRNLTRERWLLIRVIIAAQETEWKLSSHQLLQFIKNSFLAPGSGKLVALSLSVWAAAVILTAVSFATGWISPVWFLLAYITVGIYVVNQLGPVFLRGLGLSNHLAGLVPVFARLEARLDRETLKELLPTTGKARPSRQLRSFNRILSFLSAESNPLFYLVLNAVLPWAPFFTWLLEKERRRLAKTFPTCLEEFNQLEALASLAFLNIYQTQVFPQIENDPILSGKALFHPLIARQKVVANDFAFPDGKHLGLITGSNMSGKSTFLRTVGVNQTLANMGAPVFASQLSTSVFKIGSCIQVSDSLRDGFSYFYSEVIRLKTLIDEVQSGRPVLFLIDEIFRGTNNRERQIGSRAVIRSLAAEGRSLGFVSTHDLELTSLEETIPAVINLHFREDFEGGEMTFHYKIQRGPCPTTNALKIMAKAGLVLE